MKKNDAFVPEDLRDLVSMTNFLTIAWRQKLVILAIVLLSVLVGQLWSRMHVNYRSEAVLQFGGEISEDTVELKDVAPRISLEDYSRYAAAFFSAERFDEFVREKKLELTTGLVEARNTIVAPNAISRIVEPVYSFAGLDDKVGRKLSSNDNNGVVGLRIEYSNASPEVAQTVVNFLGQYAMDSVAYAAYADFFERKERQIKAKMAALERKIVDATIELENFRRKASSLKEIIARHPEATRLDPRQIISITEETAKYLSPVTLLMTTELQAAELRNSIPEIEREQKQNTVLLEYYNRAKLILDRTKSGMTLQTELESLKEALCASENVQDLSVKYVCSTLSSDHQIAANRYFYSNRFITPPTLPVHPTRSSLRVLMMSLAAGLILSLFYVFGRIWLRESKANISY